MNSFTYLDNADPVAIDELFTQFKKDPNNIDLSWRKFFEGMEFAQTNFGEIAQVPDKVIKEFRVINLIDGYRSRGHLFTKTNPVRVRRHYLPTLELKNFKLDEKDLDEIFDAGTCVGIGPSKLKDIILFLENTYCSSIGVEFMFIRDPDVIQWLLQKIEPVQNSPSFTKVQKFQIIKKLNQAVGFEQFLHTKYVGQKRFSLQGCETLIPALDAVIEMGASLGIEDFIIGMAHRGRLNVLVNILQKSYEEVFSEFEDETRVDTLFDGDVKYHLGYSSDITTSEGKKVHVSLAANPSHLEAVDPVAAGMARAKLDTKHKYDNSKVANILLHGDASIAGQGILYELIQMSRLDGYQTGGTIHIILNNQIGFTTNYLDARSSTYCTDVAKVTLSPVFHVNGDDVEAVTYVVNLAMEFRQTFHRDVFIDILGYRRYGHNEGDEPKFTQPLLYKIIEKHPNPKDIYVKKLVESDGIAPEVLKKTEDEYKELLNNKLVLVQSGKFHREQEEKLRGPWAATRPAEEKDFEQSPSTCLKKEDILKLASAITTLPTDRKFYNKIEKIITDRRKMCDGDGKIDWALAEQLAYASLLKEKYSIRFSGQDVERGTFSHRHAVLKEEDSEKEYIPLEHVSADQGKFFIYNSLLSEYAVLGYEYGYASVLPNTLVIWEAQFGDFANGAQIIFDQFISSAEDKWNRQNGICIFLPHGYEGQGPEHSSARIERYLNLCAENNMQIVNCTVPSNFFHVLRRQMGRPFRKPLIVFTPKSLLRHPSCISAIAEFTNGGFREVVDDSDIKDINSINKIILCSGKIFYELSEKRRSMGINTIAIIRMEQLYPFPEKQLNTILKKYINVKRVEWVQEEPANMGGWNFIQSKARLLNPVLVSPPESASPASGSAKKHKYRQEQVLNKALNIDTNFTN